LSSSHPSPPAPMTKTLISLCSICFVPSPGQKFAPALGPVFRRARVSRGSASVHGKRPSSRAKSTLAVQQAIQVCPALVRVQFLRDHGVSCHLNCALAHGTRYLEREYKSLLCRIQILYICTRVSSWMMMSHKKNHLTCSWVPCVRCSSRPCA
jgi:hypothetical protein